MSVARTPQRGRADIDSSERELKWLAKAIDHKDRPLKTACRLLMEL